MRTAVKNHLQNRLVFQHLYMRKPTNQIINILRLHFIINIQPIHLSTSQLQHNIMSHLHQNLLTSFIFMFLINLNPSRLIRSISILKRTYQSHMFKKLQSPLLAQTIQKSLSRTRSITQSQLRQTNTFSDLFKHPQSSIHQSRRILHIS